MKRLVLAAITITLLTLPGCLLVETLEYHIVIDKDGKHATAETIYRNVRSEQEDEQADIDFDEMLASWKGPEYLAERAKEGVTVVSRNLTIEKGMLVGRVSSTFSDSSPSYKTFFARENVRIALQAAIVDSVLKCNGRRTIEHDSIIMTWPKGTRDFKISVRFKSPPHGANFVRRFKAYLNSHPQ